MWPVLAGFASPVNQVDKCLGQSTFLLEGQFWDKMQKLFWLSKFRDQFPNQSLGSPTRFWLDVNVSKLETDVQRDLMRYEITRKCYSNTYGFLYSFRWNTSCDVQIEKSGSSVYHLPRHFGTATFEVDESGSVKSKVRRLGFIRLHWPSLKARLDCCACLPCIWLPFASRRNPRYPGSLFIVWYQ